MITSQDEKYIRDIIINRYVSRMQTTNDRYPFSPHDISQELELKWGLQISIKVNRPKRNSLNILVELLV